MYSPKSSVCAIGYCVAISQGPDDFVVWQSTGALIPATVVRIEHVQTYGEAEAIKDRWVDECRNASRLGEMAVTA